MKRLATLLAACLALGLIATGASATPPSLPALSSPDLDGDGLLSALDNPGTGGLSVLLRRGPMVSARSFQVGPQAIVCTIYSRPLGNPCSPGLANFSNYLYYYTDDCSPQPCVFWRQSTSTARRYRHGVSIWGPCLPTNARLEARYETQGGAVIGGSWIVSDFGGCGLDEYNESRVNGQFVYAWAQCRIYREGGAHVGRHLACFTEWN